MNAATMLPELLRIAPALHKAGTFSAAVLEAIMRHACARPVHHSAETGSGASTLLLSHISEDHTVFSMDGGTGSLRSVEASPLLRRDIVTFVEGPTQVTLPRHRFAHRLQLVLIDGPHAYPFPDLEYYHLYPHLDPGGLFIVDDIHIPTIGNLFDFVSADEMFDLQEVVETTGFLRRTDAPTFPPIEDGWERQRFNQRAFESAVPEVVTGPPLERTEQAMPFYLDRLGAITEPLKIARLQVPKWVELVVAGWALDALRRKPAAAVDLVLDGVVFRTDMRVPRPDVAAAHGVQGFLRCGFNARLPQEAITPGVHALEIRVIANGHRQYHSAAQIRFEAV